MANELTTSGDGLRLFFTEDIYLVNESFAFVEKQQELAEPQEVYNPAVAPPAAKIAFKFLGKNQKNILILVNDPLHEVSDELGRELLRKIVKSVNLTANDFALLNYHHYPDVSYAQLMEHFKCSILFAFGVSGLQLGLTSHPVNTVVLDGGVKLIFSAELKSLDADMQGKKALWGSLKKLGL